MRALRGSNRLPVHSSVFVLQTRIISEFPPPGRRAGSCAWREPSGGVEALLKFRGRLVRLSPGHRPAIRDERKRRHYPHGPYIEDLGPPSSRPAADAPDAGVPGDGEDP